MSIRKNNEIESLLNEIYWKQLYLLKAQYNSLKALTDLSNAFNAFNKQFFFYLFN
jgi:hypothetical protein